MSNALVAALDAAVRDAGARPISLGERLALVAARVQELSTVYADAVDAFVSRLERAGAGADAPQVGDLMPNFMMPDQDGRMVELDRLVRDGPTVVVFHRGHWCPYCRLAMAGMAEIQASIAPHSLVAISPERQKFTTMLRSEAGADFPFLSDVGSGYALSIGLAIWVDDAMASLISQAGWDVPEYQGTDGWIMPVPAVFVVGAQGRVIGRHVDPDYRHRMELEDLLGVLGRVRRQTT